MAVDLYADKRIDCATEGATADALLDEGTFRRLNRRLTRFRSDGVVGENLPSGGGGSSERSVFWSSYERVDMSNLSCYYSI